MIIYSVTVSLAPEIENDWKEWMVSNHIPNVLNTDMFIEKRMTKVIEGAEEGVINYNIQYLCESMDKLDNYQKNFAPKLQKEHSEKFGEKFIAFRTILELID